MLTTYYVKYIDYVSKYSNDLPVTELNKILNNLDKIYKNYLSSSKIDVIMHFKSSVGTQKGYFLDKFLRKHEINNCLEIGGGLGIISIYLLSHNIKLITIDPLQQTKWKNIGKKTIK